MNRLTRDLSTEDCGVQLLIPQGQGPFSVLYLEDGKELLPLVQPFVPDDLPLILAALDPACRDDAYTPWPAPPLFRSAAPFGGQAERHAQTLQHIHAEVAANFPLTGKEGHLGISLSGLFVLWHLHQKGAFCACASISGSLWYQGFAEWAMSHPPGREKADIFLSLGRGESKGRNPVLRTVDQRTQELYHFYLQRYGTEHAALSYTDGGHTAHMEERVGRAVQWMLEKLV